MTAFMFQVADALDGDVRPDRPELRDSVAKPVPVGADEQVALRALAEQLVSEANAVLPGTEVIELTDQLVDGQLGFSMCYGPRTAVITTRFGDGVAFGELLGSAARGTGSVELLGLESLQNLVLLLISDRAAS